MLKIYMWRYKLYIDLNFEDSLESSNYPFLPLSNCSVPVQTSDYETVAHADIHFLMDAVLPFLRVSPGKADAEHNQNRGHPK